MDIGRHGLSLQPAANGGQTSKDGKQEQNDAVDGHGGRSTLHELPCRIVVEARGFEWFVYNRTPAYDTVLAGMSRSADTKESESTIPDLDYKRLEESNRETKNPSSQGTAENRGPSSSTPADSHEEESKNPSVLRHIKEPISVTESKSIVNVSQNDETPTFLNFLPIAIECKKGAVVMGNENTRSILVAKVDAVKGQIDARDSGELDQYRQCFDFEFEHPIVQLKLNKEYRESQSEAATKLRKGRGDTDQSHKSSGQKGIRYQASRLMRRLFSRFHRPRSSEPQLEHTSGTRSNENLENREWQGLSRYLEEDGDGYAEQERWKAIEYGSFFDIVDSPSVTMSFFWDVPGIVPEYSRISNEGESTDTMDINGSSPPVWGLDLKVSGGKVTYGPWADRQRADLQSFFFPSLSTDAVVPRKLYAGESRVSTVFKIVIELDHEVTLRIPTREESKDWKWKNHAVAGPNLETKPGGKRAPSKAKSDKPMLNPEIRPAGWLDITVSADSSVSYTMDMVPSTSGYRNTLDLDLKAPEMSTSVNNGLLWRSKSQIVNCDLSNPRGWNTLRLWSFDILGEDMELFLLRDHQFLLSDLIGDWLLGPSVDFYNFVPFNYALKLRFPNFRIYLNANDANIINNPSALEDNTLIVVWGQQLMIDVSIPIVCHQPLSNKVTFDVEAYNGGFKLLTPTWNTQHTLLDRPDVATLKELRVDGSYNYCTSTAPTLADTVLLNIYGTAPTIHLYGFLIRYFLAFKDNYFGVDLHFQTLDEYQQAISKPREAVTVVQELVQGGQSNDIDVILTVDACDACLMLPANLYSAQENVKIDLSSITLDLRFTNYYMDIDVSFSPLAISRSTPGSPQKFGHGFDSTTQAFLDGITIYGHRLFGLPPDEPTYMCNWDFNIGSITGECNPDFLSTLLSAVKCIAFTFTDAENALPPYAPIVLHDVTFLRAKIGPIKVAVPVESAVFLFSADSVALDFNDFAGEQFSDRLHLVVPNISLACLENRLALRNRYVSQPESTTFAYFGTTLNIRMVERKAHFDDERRLQQDHLAMHDSRTRRISWLLHDGPAPPLTLQTSQWSKTRIPAMPFPPMPEPVHNVPGTETHDLQESSVSSSPAPSRPVSRYGSFLSARSARPPSSTAPPRSPNTLSSPPDSNPKSRPSISAAGASGWTRSLSHSVRLGSFSNDSEKQREARSEPHPPSTTFSSSYAIPYFPLLSLKLDLHEVPLIPKIDDTEPFSEGDGQSDSASVQGNADGEPHNTFIIESRHGIAALCTPLALGHANVLLAALQNSDAETTLDSLQIDSIGKVLSDVADRPASTRTQLRLEVPFVMIRLKDESDLSGRVRGRQQSFDLKLTRLVAMARLASSSDFPKRMENVTSSVHVSLEKMGIDATSTKTERIEAEARLSLSLSNITTWLVIDQGLHGELNFQDLEVSSLRQKIAPLISMTSQIVDVLKPILHQVEEQTERQAFRSRHLVLSLATYDAELPDPAFLTTASYVLRSAVGHLRLNDTWKVVSRLRYVLRQQNRDAKQLLQKQLVQAQAELPTDAREQVIAHLNTWRSWDLRHVEESPLLYRVFGPAKTQETRVYTASLNPYKLSLRAGRIRLLIAPGPEANQVLAEKLFIDMTSSQSAKPSSANMSSSTVRRRDSIIQASCTNIAINLNWEIYKILEDFLQDHNDSSPLSRETGQHTTSSQPVHEEQSIHFILIVRSINMSLQSINLGLATLTRGLSMSFIFSTTATADSDWSGIMNSEDSTLELSSHSKILMAIKALDPIIQFSLYRGNTENLIENILRFAALCGKIDVDIREDTLSLLGVADLLVGDELAAIYRLATPSKTEKPERTISNATKPTINRVYVNMLLDTYSIAITPLPSLKYIVNGTVTRCAISPAMGTSEAFILTFDIKENTHTFTNLVNSMSQEIAELPMPPVTGFLRLSRANSSQSITISLGIERVNLDASAVHGIVSTMSRSEVASFVTSINHDVGLISRHYDHIVDERTTQKITDMPKSETLYSARITAAGLDVGTTVVKGKDNSARLHFELGYLSLRAHNQDHETKGILALPEVEVVSQGIKVLLERANGIAYLPCGELELAISFEGSSKKGERDDWVRSYMLRSSALEINLYTETASVIVDILGQLQQRFKTLDLSQEVRNLRDRRRLRAKSQVSRPAPTVAKSTIGKEELSESLFDSGYALEMKSIGINWRVGNAAPTSPGREVENLVLTIACINLATQKHNAARLMIEMFQLQMVPASQSPAQRSFNSALLPEAVFNVAYLSTSKDRRLAFQAAGKSLDLRLTSHFILPASDLQRSIAIACQDLRKVAADWNASWPQSDTPARNVLGNKKLSSLLVDADFAGAAVYIQGKTSSDTRAVANNMLPEGRLPQHGRYGQFTHEDAGSSTTLKAPGIAVKVEYKNLGVEDPSLNAEIKVDASTNILYPTIVPLILEITSSVKEIVGEPEEKEIETESKMAASRFLDEKSLQTADPAAILGNCRLNLGLRICRQEFSLSCQPIARVAATAQFNSIYIIVNTVQSADQDRFFAISAVFSRPQASVQHVYSREATASFEVESLNISLMNSKHVSAAKGLSAIVKINSTKVLINAKQLHDFLLFREIWIPAEIRHSQPSSSSTPASPDTPMFVVQRYQQVAATGAFPWNAVVSITKLDVLLDLGQALGKSNFSITDLWVSSKKTSDWEQNLCLGFDKISVDSTGRMSGSVVLRELHLRTSIWWPSREEAYRQTPLIQASFAFDDLQIKISFDYQAFLVADVSKLDFLMYNLRHTDKSKGDRLVAIVNGDKILAFCTTSSSAQGVGLYQAIQRLIQDKQAAYQNSLKDIEKHLSRNASVLQSIAQTTTKPSQETTEPEMNAPIRLQTNVVVSLGAIKIGAFPSTFYDNQIFKLEALDASARFMVAFEDEKVQSDLGLTLGQLRIALSSVSKPSAPKTLGEVSVDEVVQSATSSRGGTILKVPRVVATMQTWQARQSYQIDYIFKSSFEGKVEVGWNYSRISFIRGMWAKHLRALAQRLGKPLPPSALQISGGPEPDSGVSDGESSLGKQEKITAVVNVPQSKYQYTALEPPIIETPQLRDMGEATPPLEWIGLQRERLPNLTHQIIIVTLLEVAKEVDDAYSKILGSS